jgi:hypothetical protein
LGVEYVYVETEPPTVAEAEIELTEGMLAALPGELRGELHQATLLLDKGALATLIQRVKPHAPDTAKGLQALMDGFQFARIRGLLKDVI